MGSLFVGDLHREVDELDLRQIFSQIGQVSSIHLCRDKYTKRSLGYAYVNYSYKEDAKEAIRTLNYLNIKGKSCRIMWSHGDKESKKTGNGNLFVKNLDKNITSKDLHEIFSQFGKILSCKVTANRNGKNPGFGYVDFQRADQAQKAIAEGNRMFIYGKAIQVSYFVPKKNRQTDPGIVKNQTKLKSEKQESQARVKHNSLKSRNESQNEMYFSQQKEVLSGILFQIVYKYYPIHAFDITARMLMEFGVNDIIELLPQQESLRVTINQTFYKMRRENTHLSSKKLWCKN